MNDTLNSTVSSTSSDTSGNTIRIEIDNLKCGGCANTILKGLNGIEGVSNVNIDNDTSLVSMTAPASLRDEIAKKLSSMGYPEKGSLTGFNAGLANAKSYVSCAIGRVTPAAG